MRAGEEDWESSLPSALKDQTTTKPLFKSTRPLLTDLQALAVSDSNTRQRQNTQLHKDTSSRLQETDTLITVMRQAKERVKERDYFPLTRGFVVEGVIVSKKLNRNPQSTHNHPSAGETLTQMTFLTKERKTKGWMWGRDAQLIQYLPDEKSDSRPKLFIIFKAIPSLLPWLCCRWWWGATGLAGLEALFLFTAAATGCVTNVN